MGEAGKDKTPAAPRGPGIWALSEVKFRSVATFDGAQAIAERGHDAAATT